MTGKRGGQRRRRRSGMSVRTRIVIVITIVAALGMLSVGTALYVVERTRILTQIDDRLTANLDSARYLVMNPDALAPATSNWPSARDALEAVVKRMSPDDNTGVVGVVAGAPSLVPGVPLDVDLLSAPGFVGHVTSAADSGEPILGTYAEEGVTWRYLVTPITITGSSPGPDTVQFVMAYDVEAELAEINDASRVYLITAAIVLALIAGAASIVATRLLRPLRRMRETAERVSVHSLSERLPIEGRDDVSELSRTMNAMLDRLDGALDSQRSLLSDVGHELKTPITIVRGYVEVMDPGDPRDVRDTQSLVVDELDRMGRLVQDLASTAALHGPAPVAPHPTDSADLVSQIVRKADGIEGAKVLPGPLANVVAPLDAARITQAMLQLAQNAVTHGGGRLMIGSSMSASHLELWVRDYGPGVADEAKQRVFDRFQRDAAGGGGSGLGLNIVRVIAHAHGGTVRVIDARDGPGAVFIISVPLAAPAVALGPAAQQSGGGNLPDERKDTRWHRS